MDLENYDDADLVSEIYLYANAFLSMTGRTLSSHDKASREYYRERHDAHLTVAHGRGLIVEDRLRFDEWGLPRGRNS